MAHNKNTEFTHDEAKQLCGLNTMIIKHRDYDEYMCACNTWDVRQSEYLVDASLNYCIKQESCMVKGNIIDDD